MQLNDSYVYCHLKADDGMPFYVGIGSTQLRPWDMHNGRSDWHKNTVKKHGICVEIVIDDLSREVAKWWEIRWIKALKDSGYKLVNMTSGGDGLNGMSHSDETKNKIRVAHVNKGELHHTKDAEFRKKNSERQKANSDNHYTKKDNHKIKFRKLINDRFGDSPMKIPEIAAKASATMLAKGANHQCKRPEVRAKISASISGVNHPNYGKTTSMNQKLSAAFTNMVRGMRYWGA